MFIDPITCLDIADTFSIPVPSRAGGTRESGRARPAVKAGSRQRASNVSPEEQAALRRRERRLLRSVSAKLLPRERVCRCGQHLDGRFEVDGTRYLTIQKGQYGAYLNGVVTCGSVWHCPVCAAKIAVQRASQINEVVLKHISAQGRIMFLTLTQGHEGWHDPKELRQAVSGRWRKLVAGKAWKTFQAATGYLGFVRALEPTHGRSGWHPHLHVLLFFDGQHSDRRIAIEVAKLACRWIELARAEGFRCENAAQHLAFCQDLAKAGDYVAKWGVASEMTHGHLKKARGEGGRSPWQILADCLHPDFPPDAEKDGKLFQQYAIAFKGARQLTWGGNIKKLYLIQEEADEVLAASPEPENTTVCALSEYAFDEVQKKGLEGAVLEAAEAGGFLSVMSLLALNGIASAGLRNADWIRQRIPDLGWGLHGPPISSRFSAVSSPNS